MALILVLILIVVLAPPSLPFPEPQVVKNLIQNTRERLLTKLPDNSDAKLDTPELIAKYGYPSETHKITTEDGYILTAHRIPHGKDASPAPPEGRPIVWLQHGLLCSSADWLYQNKDQPLGFRLADAGYDVWLGNIRGNTYSKQHKYLNVKSKEFWSFTWHEMGKYDLPAFFDYVQNVTGKPDLFYIGHSMGTTMFFVCMSLRPEYNSRVRLMSALAPVVFMPNIVSPLKYIAPYSKQVNQLANLVGAYEVLENTILNDIFGSSVCNQLSPIQELCSHVIFLIAGFDSPQLNRTIIPNIIGHTPAGTSIRTLTHYAQIVTSGKFRQFDFGKLNKAVYGQVEPPAYDLSKVTAPVALYWGNNDWFVDQGDLYRLADNLPNVQRVLRIPFAKFNHLDYLWAKDAVPLLYLTMERFMTLY